MECKDILNDLLVDFNNHALQADLAKEVARHLAACPACQQRSRQIKNISSALRRSPELNKNISISKDIDRLIRDSIPGIVRSNKATLRIKSQQRFIRILATAAAVVLLAFVGLLLLSTQAKMYRSTSKSKQRVVARKPEPAPVAVQPPAEETVNAPPEPIVPIYAKGDVDKDGKLNIVDSMIICQYILKERDISDVSNADVNNDGKVDIADSMLLAKKVSTEGR